MTYKEAREFIDQSNRYGIVPGLETITELMRRLGDPQDALKIIHVAGTNGKGSTAAFISSILTIEGYRVGRYISPTIFTYRERIQIMKKKSYDDKKEQKFSIVSDFITEDGVCETIKRIQPICEAMVNDGFHHPTAFEIETAMTMLYFVWEKVDYVVLEVGLGGRLDATNVIKSPICSVITSISMDHMQYLGDTLAKIAGEKAGIIKAGSPVVSCEQPLEVMEVLRKTSQQQGILFESVNGHNIKDINHTLEETSFCFLYEGEEERYQIHLLGEHQVENAALAVNVAKLLQKLGHSLADTSIQEGLKKAIWSGRFEIIDRNPYMVIDGAHNEGAAISLKESIGLYFTNRKIIYMIGVLSDKDYRSILRHTASLAKVIITLTPNNPRALPSVELAAVAREYCERVIDAGDLDRAIKLAYQEAEEQDVIIAFGSLSFLGDLVKTLRIRKEEEADDR